MEKETRTPLEDKVFSLIEKTHSKSPQTVGRNDDIAELCDDSIQLFELLTAFEETFETEIIYEDVVKMKIVQDIFDYLEKHKLE